jgi:hypothetical protein
MTHGEYIAAVAALTNKYRKTGADPVSIGAPMACAAAREAINSGIHRDDWLRAMQALWGEVISREGGHAQQN